jgi:drug/metabolite transporter (DMT)-like permease
MTKHSLGYLIALASALSYGVMSFFVHWNPAHFPPSQLVAVRSVFGITVLFPFVRHEIGKLFRRDSAVIWIRSATGSVGIMCYFISLQGTSSSNANLLFSTSPIFVALLAWILLRTRIGKAEIAGIFLIVLGNAVLWIPEKAPIPANVGMIGTLGALFASFAFLSISEGLKRYSAAIMVFGFSIFSLVVAYLYPSPPWLPISAGLPFLVVVGALGLSSQFLSTLSFRYLSSSIATAIGRSSIIFSGILDILYTTFHPGIFEFFSYILIFLGIYISHRYRHHFLGQTNI